MALPIAVQMFSFREQLNDNFYDTLREIKKAGYDGVEFAGLYGHEPGEIKKMCLEIGLEPVSAHVFYEEMLSGTEAVLDLYSRLGVKYIVIPCFIPDYIINEKSFEELKRNVGFLSREVEKRGMLLVYHNHDYDFTIKNGKRLLDILFDGIGPEFLKAELDICYVKIGCEDPKEYIKKYAARCPIIHFKDYYGKEPEKKFEITGETMVPVKPADFEDRPVGYGLQDIPGILKVAKASGIDWIIVEQDSPSMGLTPVECAEKSIKYLRSIGC